MFDFIVKNFYYIINIFAFWLCWQIFDKLFYKNRCSKCKSKIKFKPDLKTENERLKNKLHVEQNKSSELFDRIEKMKRVVALWHINNLSEKQLLKIIGVGPVKVSRILENRPFNDWEEFVLSEKISSYLEGKIFLWSNLNLSSVKKNHENR